MNQIDIYRGIDKFVTIEPEDNSAVYQALMGDHEVRLTFFLDYSAEFDINDWAEIFGEKYKLYTVPVVTKLSEFRYEYAMTMRHESFDLERAKFLFLGPTNLLRQPDFVLLGTPEDFLKLICQNMERISSGWTYGQLVLKPAKNIIFQGLNCLEALKKLAEEFDTEYYIEGKTINLSARNRARPVVLRYGKGYGLTQLRRSNIDSSQIITRLYTYGGTQNLPFSYRGGVPRLQFGNIPYLDYNTQRYGIIEGSLILDYIYPNRIGKLTSVSLLDVHRFSDGTLDFDINAQKLQGITPKITFNTGQLAGYTFEIKSYDHANTEFTIVKNNAEKNLTVPSATFKPAIGDTYVLHDIRMPDAYILAAETKLLQEATAYLKWRALPRVTYAITFDEIYLRDHDLTDLKLGDGITIVDDAMGVNRSIRLTSITRNIVNEKKIDVQLSDHVTTNVLAQLQNSNKYNSEAIRELNSRLENNSVLNKKITGDVLIEDGTLSIPQIPQSDAVGYKTVVVDLTTGKFYRRS